MRRELEMTFIVRLVWPVLPVKTRKPHQHLCYAALKN